MSSLSVCLSICNDCVLCKDIYSIEMPSGFSPRKDIFFWGGGMVQCSIAFKENAVLGKRDLFSD